MYELLQSFYFETPVHNVLVKCVHAPVHMVTPVFLFMP